MFQKSQLFVADVPITFPKMFLLMKADKSSDLSKLPDEVRDLVLFPPAIVNESV